MIERPISFLRGRCVSRGISERLAGEVVLFLLENPWRGRFLSLSEDRPLFIVSGRI